MLRHALPPVGTRMAALIGLLIAAGITECQEAVITGTPAAPGATKAVPGSSPVVRGPDGRPVAATPPGSPAPGQPASPGAKTAEKKDEGPSPVTRPDKPPRPPDVRELQVEPMPNGKIRFSFRGQAWADVLEWLARISAMSLDWQELPGDYLNLITQREYTLPEARDLINRHLLARGYTMLVQGEVLSVFNIQKLNPGLVPRVEPRTLDDHLPHEYVKVSFTLDWLLSEKAVEELKPMLSPNAKITPLKNTNRVEAMDAVVNLREVYAVLQHEQSPDDKQRLVREFPLHYTRAAEVIPQLQTLLGIESKPATSSRRSSPDPAEAMQQQAMMMMQMQRQAGGQPIPPPKKEVDVHLVANVRKNSVLVNAPPDKMEIISQAIQVIDVGTDRSQSLLANINRMQVYRLHSLDPDAFVQTLLDVGELDPATRLEVDSKSRAVIAYASLADHLTIRQLVERLDGSGRRFEVIPLRRLEADYVAGTIQFMMEGPKEQKNQPRYFDYYYSPFRRDDAAKQPGDQFRVDADIENNRLLLWANDVEIEEVTNLLVKLGEIPSEAGRGERVRVLDAVPPEELNGLLDRLRRSWPSLAPNPLQLPTVPEKKVEPAQPRTQGSSILREARHRESGPATPRDWLAWGGETPSDQGRPATDADRAARSGDRPDEPPAPPASVPEPARPAPTSPGSRGKRPPVSETAPPVQISVAPDGRLVLSSPDTAALDLLEELISQVAPPRRDYRVFKLKHADSFWVASYLKKFFETDSDEQTRSSRSYYYYDYYAPEKKDQDQFRLSRRRKLKFIDDPDTNSILVQGADPGQLATIEELIAVYDQPQEADANAARLTAVFQVRYSKAQVIADAVKDVYRDLLSSNDRALQNAGNPEQRSRPNAATTYIFNEGGNANEEKERTRVSFKGKLSIGVDEITNTLIVSAEGEILMRNVTEMITSLDEGAKPLSTVSVVPLSGSTNSARVRELLGRLAVETTEPVKTSPRNAPQSGPNAPAAGPAGGSPAVVTPAAP